MTVSFGKAVLNLVVEFSVFKTFISIKGYVGVFLVEAELVESDGNHSHESRNINDYDSAVSNKSKL